MVTSDAEKVKEAGLGAGKESLHREEIAGSDLSFGRSFCLHVKNLSGMGGKRCGVKC